MKMNAYPPGKNSNERMGVKFKQKKKTNFVTAQRFELSQNTQTRKRNPGCEPAA